MQRSELPPAVGIPRQAHYTNQSGSVTCFIHLLLQSLSATSAVHIHSISLAHAPCHAPLVPAHRSPMPFAAGDDGY
ncbi:hypothetical protein E2C01_074275 [Portunus trituberculatus]|uniref:Uncharacterized protein n=1 Tax=Portunus trituberculatus TaxID=210409 RepID=A0A5B7I2Y8_PORTR|nr:hypothetical protein [Portunus trituberculatus]